MGRVQHGYAIGYVHCTVPAAHPGPRDYVFDKLFPAVREATRKNFGLEVFTHCGTDDKWPPTHLEPERAIWTTRPSSSPTPTGCATGCPSWPKRPGHESFERRIYAHYALIAERPGLRRRPRQGDAGRLPGRRPGRRRGRQGQGRDRASSGTSSPGSTSSYGKVDVLVYKERERLGAHPGHERPGQDRAAHARGARARQRRRVHGQGRRDRRGAACRAAT